MEGSSQNMANVCLCHLCFISLKSKMQFWKFFLLILSLKCFYLRKKSFASNVFFNLRVAQNGTKHDKLFQTASFGNSTINKIEIDPYVLIF